MLTERQVRALMVMSKYDGWPVLSQVSREVGIPAASLWHLYNRFGRVEGGEPVKPQSQPKRKKKKAKGKAKPRVIPTSAFIYCLKCPLSGVIKYVGSTADPRRRLWGHVLGGGVSKALAEWISDLYHQELEPVMTILEEVPLEQQYLRESEWIDKLTAEGVELLNVERGQRVRRRQVRTW